MYRLGIIGAVLGIIVCAGCNSDSGLLLPARDSGAADPNASALVLRMVQISDTHVVDTASPARFPGGQVITRAAWRPYEAYSMQILDGIVRTVNRIHASGRKIDFLLHTGDGCDNAQSNELNWLLGVLDGERIEPLSGPDDRPAETRPATALDPYTPFTAQGLYQAGRHGALDSIPWYAAFGNHDVYAIGVLPIVEAEDGHRTAPLPLPGRPGLVLPVRFDPTGSLGYGSVTPAQPGPPPFLDRPSYVTPNPDRAYFSKDGYRAAMFTTQTGPLGHGFSAADGPNRWQVNPVAGVRLIGLDTTERTKEIPTSICPDGAMSRAQLAELESELEAAAQRGELAIVASHHPSEYLATNEGSEVTPEELRGVLTAHPNVVLHLAGHTHRNRVWQRDGYLEIETCSTLDPPQEGRLIELWRNPVGGEIAVAYEMFSHVNDTLPPLGDDPLRTMRETARVIANGDKEAAARQLQFDPSEEDPRGTPGDRSGVVVLKR